MITPFEHRRASRIRPLSVEPFGILLERFSTYANEIRIRVLRHLQKNPMSKRIRFHLIYDSARDSGVFGVPDIVEKAIHVQTMEYNIKKK